MIYDMTNFLILWFYDEKEFLSLSDFGLKVIIAIKD